MSLLAKIAPVITSVLITVQIASAQTQGVKLDTGRIHYLSEPLIRSIFTADPSAHIFNGTVYIYCSHDIDTDKPSAGGDHYDMKDFHMLSLNPDGTSAKDNGIGLALENVPWASRQLWAPDAAMENGKYYLYFPAKDKNGAFRIGVAIGKRPTGPFVAEKEPIKNSFSIDPCVFEDTDGTYYMYFGGLWGGQLQQWLSGKFDPNINEKDVGDGASPALTAKVARLKNNMLEFDELPKDVLITDEAGKPLLTRDHDRRFFEGAWMFKYQDKYYFTYSTGDTHKLCYGIGNRPYGPFIYKGVILSPVQGWTTHHSIIQRDGKWYLFYHDTEISGKSWLRNVKVTPLKFNADGTILTIDPM